MSGLSRLLLLALVSSSVAGCADGPKVWTHDEIEDIASDAAYDAVGELTGSYETNDYQSQIANLERQVSDQESEINRLESEIDSLRSELSYIEIDSHSH